VQLKSYSSRLIKSIFFLADFICPELEINLFAPHVQHLDTYKQPDELRHVGWYLSHSGHCCFHAETCYCYLLECAASHIEVRSAQHCKAAHRTQHICQLSHHRWLVRTSSCNEEPSLRYCEVAHRAWWQLVLPPPHSRDRTALAMAWPPPCFYNFLADVYVVGYVYKNLGFIFSQVTYVVAIICGALSDKSLNICAMIRAVPYWPSHKVRRPCCVTLSIFCCV
jgi:hypothetical protein